MGEVVGRLGYKLVLMFLFSSQFIVKLHVAISLLVSPPLSLLISPLSLLASFGSFLSPIAPVLSISYVRQTHLKRE